MPPKQASPGAGQQVDLSTLPPQTLQQIHNQLNTELSHLQTSSQSLMSARSRFLSCQTSLTSLPAQPKSGTEQTQTNLLVPLTTSLYVPGHLAQTDKVLVDIGTGFYVEKAISDAKKFYEAKVEEIAGQVRQIEEIVRQKSGSLRVVEDVLRSRAASGGQAQAQAQGQAQEAGA